MPMSRKRRKSFYKKKLQGLIVHLKKMGNSKINTYIEAHYNELDTLNDDDIGRIINSKRRVKIPGKENCVYSNGIEYIPYKTLGKNCKLYDFMYDIALIIYEDDSLSNIRFIEYLDKNNISVVLGDILSKFHQKCFKEAYEKRNAKDLEKVFYFKYLECSLKKDIARIIGERLAVKKGTSQLELWKWTFNSKIEFQKLNYLHSVKENVSEREYLNLLALCIKEGSRRDIEIYIFNYLFEKGEIQKNLDLMKLAFQENIANFKNGKQYFNLMFDYANSNKDIKLLRWMNSIYSHTYYTKFVASGDKVVQEAIKSLTT